MKTYTKYKDSGIEWLGKIPAHWDCSKLRFIGNFTASGIDKKIVEGEPLVQIVNYTDVYGNTRKILNSDRDYMVVSCPEDKKLEHQVKKGDLIFTPSSETVEDIGISALIDDDIENTAYSYHVLRFRFEKNIEHKFKKYLCNNHFVLSQFSSNAKGTTRQILNQDNFNSTYVVIPTNEEQFAIGDYLDRETAKIDAMVLAKEKLLELAIEKRSALISHAVTRGINPIVHLRESGIPWLGQIPKHWEVERTRWLFSERDERSLTGLEEMLTVSHLTGVTPRSEKNVNMFEAETTEGYKLCYTGDLVINTLWAWMGAMGVSKVNGLVSPAYNVYTPNDRLDPAYVDALVRMPIFAQEATRYSKGVWSSRLRLYPEGFFEIWLPLPPVDEQREIVGYIEKETSKIEALRDAAERTIGLLKERRAALITEAVTGRIEVN